MCVVRVVVCCLVLFLFLFCLVYVFCLAYSIVSVFWCLPFVFGLCVICVRLCSLFVCFVSGLCLIACADAFLGLLICSIVLVCMLDMIWLVVCL